MATYTLTKIDNGYNSYKQITELYNTFKNTFFDTIDIHLDQWFGANMAAVLGGVLDLFIDNMNTVSINIENSDTENVLLRNGFLSYYGYERVYDDRRSTIKYLKIKPTDGRFFNSYALREEIDSNDLF
ncbi:MAG: hypothetical protein JXN63_08725 [Candidatus Delongbacteria bacterium]|nr:hypothetical protein [Candidatus Delongbacteria bacterium]